MGILNRLESLFVAASFAEENEAEEARRILKEEIPEEKKACEGPLGRAGAAKPLEI